VQSTETFPVRDGNDVVAYVVTLTVRTGFKANVSWSCTCGCSSKSDDRLTSVEGRQQAEGHALDCPGQARDEAEANRPQARPGEGWIVRP
jgi:hypothetical protein